MRRWLPAPGSDSQSVNGGVLGVWLDSDERVEWMYTILPDGKRVVTGYDILPALPPKSDDEIKKHLITCFAVSSSFH